MNGGFVSNAVCDSCTTVIPAKDGLKDRLEKVLAETDLQEYKVSREGDRITRLHRHLESMQRQLPVRVWQKQALRMTL